MCDLQVEKNSCRKEIIFQISFDIFQLALHSVIHNGNVNPNKDSKCQLKNVK